MEKTPGFKPVTKVIILYLVFMVFYGVYRAFPVFPLSIFSGITESNFQHYKAAFFTFLVVDLIEYLFYHKRIENTSAFWYGRLMMALFIPWVVFLLWYIAPAVYGQFPTQLGEIIYANIVTILALICAVILEAGFLRIPFSRNMKVVVWGLLLVSIMLFMVFTFSHLPWADVFVEPNWK
jgi:hypothetical protein